MLARSDKRSGLVRGNNAHVRLAKAGHQQFFAIGHGVKQVRVPAQ